MRWTPSSYSDGWSRQDMNLNQASQFKHGGRLRRGFTLVELLIAMTITLLLMAGLAKTFAMIGNSIKQGRSKVTLSSKMRGISFRLRGDLRARTIDARPPASTEAGQGYFMYYEGPLTEQTFSLYGACPERTLTDGSVVYPFTNRDDPPATATSDARFFGTNAGPTYRLHSRLGDFDDYIAFTAEAPGDDWFTGKVPAYLDFQYARRGQPGIFQFIAKQLRQFTLNLGCETFAAREFFRHIDWFVSKGAL